MIYMEASAKSNKNVENIFTRISAEMRHKFTSQVSQPVQKEEVKKKNTSLIPIKPEKAKLAKMTCCWKSDYLFTLLFQYLLLTIISPCKYGNNILLQFYYTSIKIVP